MKLFYFSATGNSLYAARRIKKLLEEAGEESIELISIPQANKLESPAYEDAVIGFVVPVHRLGLPENVQSFMQKASFECEYSFVAATYGDNFVSAASNIETQCLMKASIEVDLVCGIEMVENYLPLFNIKKTQRKISQEQMDANIDRAAERIAAREHDIQQPGFKEKMAAKTYLMLNTFRTDENAYRYFTFEKPCLDCSVCVEICPVGAIERVDKYKVKIANSCVGCLACAHACPFGILHVAGDVGRLQYRNANVTLEDLIEANKVI